MKYDVIKISELKTNTWNPNEMQESDYEHLKREIKRVGFIDLTTKQKF